MAEISYDEETSRDWDWFAVDDESDIGHFATATFRLLPTSVRGDWERAEELITFSQQRNGAWRRYIVRGSKG